MDPKNCVIMKDQFDRIQAAKLKIQNKKFSVYRGVNIIGRNKSAAIDVKNLNISQYHALIIIIDDSQHFISDLNSSNGTYLFGTKLSPFKLYELSSDTEVKFGDVVGLYLKMPNVSATIHLENESMEATQTTQNFTQTFYAASTQLLPNDSSFSQTTLFKVPHQNDLSRNVEDIHEAATQVVDNPPTIPHLGACKNSNIIETVSSDIHEASTQVIALPPEQPSTSRIDEVDISEAPTQLISDQLQENIHEVIAQVVVHSQKKVDMNNQKEESHKSEAKISENTHSSDTQLTTSLTLEKVNEIPSDRVTNSIDNVQQKANINVIEESLIENSIVEDNPSENQSASPDENSNDSVDFFEDTQDIVKPKKRLLRKLSSSEDLSQNHADERLCNSDVDAAGNMAKKSIQESNSSEDLLENKAMPQAGNSDSETDFEDDFPEKRYNQIRVIGSDSDTDIEDGIKDITLTQTSDVIKPKILSKKMNFNSDSETDVEDKENEPVMQAAPEQDDAATEILNDTDCIPPTQDAFANMFDYKNLKVSNSNLNSQNVSSEESFKLGLTELMDYNDENVKLPAEEDKENHTNTSDDKPSTSIKDDAKKPTDDELYMMPTQKISTKIDEDIHMPPQKTMMDAPIIENDPCNPKMEAVIEKDPDDNLYMMPTQQLNETQSFDKQKDDIYFMPTQVLGMKNTSTNTKMVSNVEKDADEDFYMMPTQKLGDDNANFKTPQKFTFKKKTTALDKSLTSILGGKHEQDPYLMDTQKINEADDIYMQPTQKLEDNRPQQEEKDGIKDKNEKKDIYNEPTQHLNLPGPSNERKDVEEDPYMMSTQQINRGLATERNVDKSGSSEKNIYTRETQKIDDKMYVLTRQSKNANAEVPEPLQNEDLFEQPTQPLSSIIEECKNQSNNAVSKTTKKPTTEQRDVKSSSKRGGATSSDAPQRKRTKKSDIENLKKTIESKDRVDDAETLSQIDAFIKKPLGNTSKLFNKGECSKGTVEKIETRDQAEAFVKKPLGKPVAKSKTVLKTPSSSNQKEEGPEWSETLSQIEAFVKQPLETPPSKQLPKTEVNRLTNINVKNSSDELPEELVKITTRTRRTRPSEINKEETKQEKETLLKRKSTRQTKGETSNEEKDVNTDKSICTSHLESDTVKTDIDQSFALLEAKSVKTRKSSRITGVSEIKVSVGKNRRSMATSSIAELPESDGVKSKPSTRRTRKGITMDNVDPASGTNVGERSKRKPEPTKFEQKLDDSSDSDISEREIPTKMMKVSVTRRSKSKDKVSDNTSTKPANSGESSRGKESSMSKIRASSRLMISERSEDTRSCDGERSSSNDPSFLTPTRRGRNTAKNDALLSSVERGKRKQRPKVVFTMLDNPLLESYIRQLGGTVVDSVEACTVLVTEHVKRSQKLLTAVGQAKPICSPDWIHASRKANDFLDPWEFILTDREAESKWSFSLKDSLSKATNEKLLANYTFQLMVNSAVDVIRGAIEACGGKCVTRPPQKNSDGFFVIVASPENRTKYLKVKKQNPEVTVVEPEAIFDGVLRQDLRLGRHLLT